MPCKLSESRDLTELWINWWVWGGTRSKRDANEDAYQIFMFHLRFSCL